MLQDHTVKCFWLQARDDQKAEKYSLLKWENTLEHGIWTSDIYIAEESILFDVLLILLSINLRKKWLLSLSY
jgi:hypothetical protein